MTVESLPTLLERHPLIESAVLTGSRAVHGHWGRRWWRLPRFPAAIDSDMAARDASVAHLGTAVSRVAEHAVLVRLGQAGILPR